MFRLTINNLDSKVLAHRIRLHLVREAKPMEIVQPNDKELWLVDNDAADNFATEVRLGTYSPGVAVADLAEDLDYAVRRPTIH